MQQSQETRPPRRKRFFAALFREIHRDKRTFAVYTILQTAILAITVLNIVKGEWESVFTCVLALLLLLIPSFISSSFHVKLPTTLEILAYVFVFCAEILGEIGNYYVRFPFWDTMLHTVNGFMFAAFGFCLVDIFNKNKRFRFALSPLFLALVAFCFSMTIGTMWEFFEYGADTFLATDMQKDFFRDSINTVSLPNVQGDKVTHIPDIVTTTVTTANGEVITMDGYLDIGLKDTMKDLFVNFIGAAVFSVIGFVYVKQRGKGRIARQFIPTVVGAEENAPETFDAAEKDKDTP